MQEEFDEGDAVEPSGHTRALRAPAAGGKGSRRQRHGEAEHDERQGEEPSDVPATNRPLAAGRALMTEHADPLREIGCRPRRSEAVQAGSDYTQ